jgi:hypothetical protein
MCSLALIIFVVSEKKAFEHFPIGSNVNLTLSFLFRYEIQNAAMGGLSLTLDPMGKMFQNASSLVSEKKAFEHFPIVSNVNLCIAVAAILDFRSA